MLQSKHKEGILFALYFLVAGLLFGPIFLASIPEEKKPGSDPLVKSLVADNFTDAERDAFIEKHVASTVQVSAYSHSKNSGLSLGYGTGVIISSDGYILTANHLVEDAEFVFVTLHRANEERTGFDNLRNEPADVIAFSKEHDCALLKLRHPKGLDLPPMDIAEGWTPTEGELLWYIGKTTRWGRGLVTYTNTKAGNSAGLVGVKAHAYLGDSGGPFFTSEGKLVGILIIISSPHYATLFVPIQTVIEAVVGDLVQRLAAGADTTAATPADAGVDTSTD